MSENTECHAGYCNGCGNMVSVSVNDGSASHRKWVSGMLKDGLRVERVTVKQAREGLEFCACKPREAKAHQEALAL